jgi:hypothetical protein
MDPYVTSLLSTQKLQQIYIKTFASQKLESLFGISHQNTGVLSTIQGQILSLGLII